MWRENDCRRNSISMLAQSLYSPKELHKKNSTELLKMCSDKEKDWNTYPLEFQRGWCVLKKKDPISGRNQWSVDKEIPIFSEKPEYVNQFVDIEEEK